MALLTGPDLLTELRTRAQGAMSDGSSNDNFRLKFSYRRDRNAMPVNLMGFKEATLDQISRVEEWFHPLVSNAKGMYEMTVFHEADAMTQIGFLTFALEGRDTAPKFEWTPLYRNNWAGPKLAYPQLPDQQEQPLSFSAGSPYGAPRPTGTGEATQIQQRDLDRRERELELKSIREEIRANTKPTGGSLTELAPLALDFFKHQADQRRAEREAERDEQRRADERAKADRDAADKRFETLITAMTKKSPLEEKLMERALAPPDEAATKMLASMGQAMSMMTQNSIQLMHLQLEWQAQNSPEDDGPIMKLLNKGLDAYISTVQIAGEVVDDNAEKTRQLGAGDESDEEVTEDDFKDLDPVPALELALRRKASVALVTERLKIAFKDKEFQELVNKYKGNLKGLIGERLGGWIRKAPEVNVPYLNSVLVPALKECQRLGLVESKPPPSAPKKKKAAPPPEKEATPATDTPPPAATA